MTVEELIIYGKKYTSSAHAKMLLASYLEVNPLELLTILDRKVEEETISLYKKSLEALKENRPIQYVIGHVNFYGSTFYINENVLIPRFETEELVANIKDYLKSNNIKAPKILDLGCGSGVIGLTLKKFFPNATVTLTDISDAALEVAKTNARNLNLNVNFFQSDWFTSIPIEKYDVIVSNPPYIKTNEEIEEIVRNNEPHLALYAGIDGLDSYRNILKDINKYLNKTFLLAFEIGYEQGEYLYKLVNDTFENVTITIKKDLSNKDRMLFVEKNSD
ncbi:MAG TPA: peptide chain release factor N(5)-glutamine methyltransferase [Candidatus Onthousia faecavium]|nr:peptide chain release factor N(5)-glutamine methyltransferase [Candidatus Onthousia faecavium]